MQKILREEKMRNSIVYLFILPFLPLQNGTFFYETSYKHFLGVVQTCWEGAKGRNSLEKVIPDGC